ncbi:MAG: hypothetical protein QF570_16930 [Myxococcota bacterium]|jgi:hypothetical protein|nr:hypothetical protein [Myxococcota bacterium]
MEFFRIESRVETRNSHDPSRNGVGLRLRAGLYKHAAQAWGARWRGPFEDEEDDGDDDAGSSQTAPSKRGSAFFDDIAMGQGSDPVTVVSATRRDGAAHALRAALYRTVDPAAAFPPVCVTPTAITVRSGALHAGLQRLSDRSIPVHTIDLLGVDGSAMPEALRVVTAAITRDRKSEHPGRWIVLLDPLYESRIGLWSDDNFYGQVRIERTEPIDRVSLDVEIEPGSAAMSARVVGSLSALYLGLSSYGGFRNGVDWLAKDIATLHSVVEHAIGGLDDERPIEVERSLTLNPYVEDLARLTHEHESDLIDKDEFIDHNLDILSELRREEPDEATPVAEFMAAYADSHPFEPVPLPGDAGFVETIGRPPAVQRIVGGPRRVPVLGDDS